MRFRLDTCQDMEQGEARGAGVPSSVRLIVKSEAFEISRSAI